MNEYKLNYVSWKVVGVNHHLHVNVVPATTLKDHTNMFALWPSRFITYIKLNEHKTKFGALMSRFTFFEQPEVGRQITLLVTQQKNVK